MDTQIPASPEPSPPKVTSYHTAAAVLSHFDPEAIRPVDAATPEADFRALLADCTVLPGDDGRPVWSLRLDVRQRVLQDMPRQAMLQALQANPQRPRDTIQEVFEAYLNGREIALPDQSPQAMKAIARVVEWVGGVLPNVPRQDDLKAYFDRDQLLAAFRALADQHFAGRSSELEDLRDYVGVLPPSDFTRTVRRVVRGAMRWQSKVLMIHGLGGVGKSTIIAKFLLEHAEAGPAFRFPFVYLDFDRTELNPLEPVTLVAEAARQIAAQYPEVRAEALELRGTLLGELHTARRRRKRPAGGAGRAAAHAPPVNPSHYADSIYRILDRVTTQDKPVLIVLDTFELVQHHGPAAVDTLWQFLQRLRDRESRLRVVLSGRALLDHPEVYPVNVGPLDDGAAIEHLASLGVADAALARQVVEKVGGHPLCLRLAARLMLEDSDPRTLADIRTRGRLMFRLDAEVIQGLLYERLLGQLGLKDRRLLKLAHPGLILRRVTDEIILEVLSEPCGLQLRGMEEAKELFDKLGAHVWVVERTADGALRHRPDLRAVMLPLLRADKRYDANAIHRAAVRYYAQRNGPLARTEEIYHRLMLGEDTAQIQQRWMEGVEKDLWPSYEDFSASAKVTVRTLSGESVDPQVTAQADQEAWERIAWTEAMKAMALGLPQQALQILRQRTQRLPGSRLFGVQAEALLGLQRTREALDVLSAGVQSAYAAGLSAHADVLDLVLRRAQVEHVNVDPTLDAVPLERDRLAQRLAEFDTLCRRYGGDARLLELGALMLASHSRLPADGADSALPALEDRLMDLWDRQPSAIPEGEHFALAFYLIGALYAGRPERVRARIRDANLGAELATAAAAELGTSQRSCRDLLAGLGRAVDATLPARSATEAANAWLDTAEHTARYVPLAYTYGRLLDELLANLAALPADEASALLRLLRGVLEPPADTGAADAPRVWPQDPRPLRERARWSVDTVLLEGGLPFLGRHQLRRFLRGLSEPQSERILLVTGPPGSGKTYSLRLISAMAHSTGGFDFAAVSLQQPGAPATASELMKLIARTLGLAHDSMPASWFTASPASLARWFAAQLAGRTQPLVLAIDNLDVLARTHDADELLLQLARDAAAHRPPCLRLVLLGYPPSALAPELLASTVVEELTPLTESDVAEFLSKLGADQRIDREEQRSLLEALGRRIASARRDESNPQLNEALRVLATLRFDRP